MITSVLTLIAVALSLFDGSLVEWQRGGETWRAITGHFTHWTREQLLWDALAFFALGIVCERRSRTAFVATLSLSALLVPLAIAFFAPEVAAYRGLSGLASALFALLLFESRRSKVAMAFGIAFAAKITFEAITGGTVFASNLGSGVVSVPAAHLAGAVSGLLAGVISEVARRRGRSSRATHSRPHESPA